MAVDPPRLDDWGGGREPFGVDSFHATSIGLMLKAENIEGDAAPRPPAVEPLLHGIMQATVIETRTVSHHCYTLN